MARTTYKKRLIDGQEYYYEVIELPRKSNGKRNRKYVCAKTVSELKSKLADIKNDIYQGVNVTDTNSFGTLLNEWLYNIHLKNKKMSTINRYEGVYEIYVKDSLLTNKRVKDLKIIDVQKYYNSLENEGISSNTISMIHRIIKPFLKYLYINGYTVKNLGESGVLKLPKIVKKNLKIPVLTIEEQKKFIDSLYETNDPDKLIYIFAIGTGLRIGELLALTWNDIKNDMVHVDKNIKNIKIDGKWKLLCQDTPKTEKSNRNVPIPHDILEELKIHKENQNIIKSKAGSLYCDNNIIFATDFGKYIDPGNLNKRFQRALKRADIKPINFHGLRHTYATRLFERDVQAKVVSELLGHSNIATTLNTYTWVLESKKKEAINTINDIFKLNDDN